MLLSLGFECLWGLFSVAIRGLVESLCAIRANASLELIVEDRGLLSLLCGLNVLTSPSLSVIEESPRDDKCNLSVAYLLFGFIGISSMFWPHISASFSSAVRGR